MAAPVARLLVHGQAAYDSRGMHRSGLSGFHVSTAMLRPMLVGLGLLHADVEKIAASVSLSVRDLHDPDVRIPFEVAIRFSIEAAVALGDPAFGLHLAELYQPGVFGVLDYLAHSSRTLGEAISHLCRYNRLLQDAAETFLDVEGVRAVVWQRTVDSVWLPPGIVENALANLIMIGRNLTGKDLRPVEVRFRHSDPGYADEHRRVFKAPIRFDADRDAVVLRAVDLDLPLTNTDPVLCSILDRHAQRLLEELPRVASFSSRVRELVAADLRNGNITASEIAARLQMSERTLRRRLKLEGTTYEELLDELRRALTQRYLNDPQLSIEQIALMLGYSEASAFRRAFRRWHGESPASFRARRQA